MSVLPLQNRLKELPTKPGIYLFKNQQGNVLYVGKAKALNKRVQSYFRASVDLSEAKQLMVQQITTLDWIETKTETDALVLEDKLIKDYQPRFNILAKDDKHFLYIHITAETFPRVLAVRRPNLKTGGMFYGPYPFARSLRDVLKLVHTIFSVRTCKKLPKRACLEYYLGNCPAPCINKIAALDYQKIIQQIIDVFEGNSAIVQAKLQARMQQAAKQQLFEVAARARDQLTALKKLQSLRKTPQQYLAEHYKQTNIDPQQGLRGLTKVLGLAKIPHRIEVYDISNIQGNFSVGSMIVFINGLPDNSEYRRFKIKTVTGADDFKSLREVVTRRLKRAWPLPDLAIMDGGKGQLQAVVDLWQQVNVPVVALAKQREELFWPEKTLPKLCAPGSQELFLVQRMRDEAHRFAIRYYRLLHRKTMRGD
ncbi:MAG: excinuclease ABC subunit UvrC [Patescibacteria group bacterium]|jgi:excinuclease ABC subunit C